MPAAYQSECTLQGNKIEFRIIFQALHSACEHSERTNGTEHELLYCVFYITLIKIERKRVRGPKRMKMRLAARARILYYIILYHNIPIMFRAAALNVRVCSSRNAINAIKLFHSLGRREMEERMRLRDIKCIRTHINIRIILFIKAH